MKNIIFAFILSVVGIMSMSAHAADKYYNFMCERLVTLTGNPNGGFSKTGDGYVEYYFRMNLTQKRFQMIDVQKSEIQIDIPYEILSDGIFMVFGGAGGPWQVDIMTNTRKQVDDFQLIKHRSDVGMEVIREKGYRNYQYDYAFKNCKSLPSNFYG